MGGGLQNIVSFADAVWLFQLGIGHLFSENSEIFCKSLKVYKNMTNFSRSLHTHPNMNLFSVHHSSCNQWQGVAIRL